LDQRVTAIILGRISLEHGIGREIKLSHEGPVTGRRNHIVDVLADTAFIRIMAGMTDSKV
jgi:hypothetical protein